MSDQYDKAAAALLPTLTTQELAELLRQKDEEHRHKVRIVSAMLELLGGQVFLPLHALKDAPGYQEMPGGHSGDVVLTSSAVSPR